MLSNRPSIFSLGLWLGVLTYLLLLFFATITEVVDKENKNCFMLFARILSVIWGTHEECWSWIMEKDR